MLDEVVKEMKGIEVEKETELQIDLDVTSYIPDEYISDSNQKIEVYQNIALCKCEEDIQNVIDEIIDRYGNMPNELENLIDIARIKYLAKNLSKISTKGLNKSENEDAKDAANKTTAGINISKIASKNKNVVISFETKDGKVNIDIEKLVRKYGNRIKFSAGIKPSITLNVESNDEKKILKSTTELVMTLANDV